MGEIKRDDWQYKVENAMECPFCSNKSISVKHKEVRFLGQNAFGIKKHKMKAYCVCNKCKATGTPIYYIGYSGAVKQFYDEEHLPVYSCGDKAIEKWNTREPMQEIVERLEREKVSKMFVGGRSNGKTLKTGINYGIATAIEIVKEVGGMNELSKV